MGAQGKSQATANSMQRVKVYCLNDDGKWDDKGTGHVTIDFLERSEELGLLVIDEEDNETILLHRISPEDIYRKQEGTIISWSDPEYSTEFALSFQETTGCSYIWDNICNVQRNLNFSSLNGETFHSMNSELRKLPAVELSTLPLILKKNVNASAPSKDQELISNDSHASQPTIIEKTQKRKQSISRQWPPKKSKEPGSRTVIPSTNRLRPPASTVWEFFTKIEEVDRCICNYCGKDYACNSQRHGTGGLWIHLKNCKQYNSKMEEDEKQKMLYNPSKRIGGDNIPSGSGSNLVAVSFNKEECRKACMKMILVDELPFKFVEAKGFRYFCSVACPKFDPPSQSTIARDVFQLYLDEKKALKSLFITNKQRVSLTTNIWTSIQNNNYMVVTAHFIDCEWKLQKRILNFCLIQNHKRETIGKLIELCLHEWGIEKLFTIMVDNASANDVAINCVKKKMKSWKEDALVLDGEFLHMQCCTHILNLIVTEGLKSVHNSILCIRNAVRYIKLFPFRLQKFNICGNQEKLEYKGNLILDVPTKWNSTYMMLASALQYQKAFKRMAEEDRHYLAYFLEEEIDGSEMMGPPKQEDWDNAHYIVKFLKIFYDVTLKFSASLEVTSNIYFHEMCTIQNELLTLIANDDFFLSKMASGMKNKFDKYWGSVDHMNKMLIISVLLDPRCKTDYIQYCFNRLYDSTKVEAMVIEIRNLLFKLYESYKAWNSTNSEVSGANTQQSIGIQMSYEIGTRKGKGSIGGMFSDYMKLKENKDSIESKNEVERYLMEPNEDFINDDFEILSWWKLNSAKYPILSHIAKDVFAIPISTMASESAFSTGRRILDHFQSSLSPKMMEALICGQNWIEQSLFLEQSGDDVSIVEIEDNQFNSVVAELMGATSMSTINQIQESLWSF